MLMTQFICGKCIRTIDANKVSFCSLIDGSDYYMRVDLDSVDNLMIKGIKNFVIRVGESSEIRIVPDHIDEIANYIKNELSENPSGDDTERVSAYIASWMSRINEKLYQAFVGNSVEGKTDGYITPSRGFDGIDINIEMLARQTRLADLVKEELPEEEMPEEEDKS